MESAPRNLERIRGGSHDLGLDPTQTKELTGRSDNTDDDGRESEEKRVSNIMPVTPCRSGILAVTAGGFSDTVLRWSPDFESSNWMHRAFGSMMRPQSKSSIARRWSVPTRSPTISRRPGPILHLETITKPAGITLVAHLLNGSVEKVPGLT